MDKQTIIALLKDQGNNIQAKKNNFQAQSFMSFPYNTRTKGIVIAIFAISAFTASQTINNSYYSKSAQIEPALTEKAQFIPTTYAPYQIIDRSEDCTGLIQTIGDKVICQTGI